MSTQSPDFFQEELDGRQTAALVADASLTPNMVIESLWHGRVLVRRNAALALAAIAPIAEAAEAVVAIASRDSDALVRASIVRAVAQNVCSVGTAVPILLDGLLNSDEEIRVVAYNGLVTRLQRERAATAPLLVKGLKDLRGAVVAACAKILTEDGDAASVPLLIPLLGCGDNRIVRPAYDVVDRLKYEAVEALIAAIADPLTRRFAVKLLSGLPRVSDDERRALDASWALADSLGDAPWRAAVVAVLDELTRLVVPVRTQPLNLPIADFGIVRLSESALESAAQALQAPEDLDEALYALRDGREHVRHNALVLLRFMHWPPGRSGVVAAKVLPLVKDADLGVRLAAMATLGRFDAAYVAVGALAALGEPNPDLHQAAVTALREAGPAALAATLQRLPLHVEARTSDGLLAVVVALGGAAVTVLADAIAHGAGLSATARVVAVRGLGLLGATAEVGLSVLIAALTDSLEDVRREAAISIGYIGVNDPAIIGALKGQMQDQVPTVRRQAALAIARITGQPLDDRGAREARPVPIVDFEVALSGPEHLEVVSEFGDDGYPVVDPALLVHALRDGRVIVRRNAARAIGALGARGAPFAVQLALALRDADVDVRRDSAEALLALGEHAEAALAFAIIGLADRDEALHTTLVRFIAGLFPTSEPFIIEGLRVEPDAADEGIFDVIRALEQNIVLGLATSGLSHASGLIRLNAARALGELSAKGAITAVDALTGALSDPLGQVRVAAEAALDRILLLKPRPIRVLEPVPLPFSGFDTTLATPQMLSAHSESLAALDDATVLRLLADGRATVRANAVAVAATMASTPALVSNVTCLLRDAEATVRLNAVAFLVRPPASLAVGRALAPLVLDREPTVAAAVAAAFDAHAALFFPALVALGGSVSEFDLRRAVFPRVRAGGDMSGAALAQLLAPESETPDAVAVTALRLLRAFDFPALLAMRGGEICATLTARAEVLMRSTDAALRRAATAAHARLTGADSQPAALESLPLPAAGFDTGLLAPAQLEMIADEVPLDALLHLLADGRAFVRHNAAVLLRFVGWPAGASGPVAAKVLLLVKDPDLNVRLAAMATLGRFDVLVVSVGALAALGDAHPDVQKAGVTALREGGPAALAAALRRLPLHVEARTEDGLLAVAVALGDASVAVLADAVADKASFSAAARVVAIRGLGRLGAIAQDALSVLLAAFGDSVETVRGEAATAVGNLGVDDPAILGALRALFQDQAVTVRRQAALAVALVTGKSLDDRGASDPRPVPIAGFETALVGAEQLEVLRDVRDDGAPVVDPSLLVQALRDGRALLRRNAARAIGALGDRASPLAVPLALALRDADVEVRRDAAEGLLALGEHAASGLAFAVNALADRDEALHTTLVSFIAGLFPISEPFIIEGLRVEPEAADVGIFDVVRALESHIVPGLAASGLSHSSGLIRINAARALHVLCDKGAITAVEALTEALSDRIGQVRTAAEAALDRILLLKPRPIRVLEPVPLPFEGFDQAVATREILSAHRDSIASLEPATLPRLLADGRSLVRANAIAVAATTQTTPALVSNVTCLLRDADPSVRLNAVAFLVRTSASLTTGKALAPLILDPDPQVAAAVAQAFDAHTALFFPALVAFSGSVSAFDLQRSIFPRVQAGGDASVASLARLLAPESETADAVTVTALRLLRAFAYPTLVAMRQGAPVAQLTARAEVLMRSSDAALRRAATAAHARLTGADSQPAAAEPVPLPAEGFESALWSRDQLAAIAGDLRFDLLLHALGDGRETVRANATAALGQLGAAEGSSVGPLCRMLRDTSGHVRALAAESLGLLSPSREASFALVGALFDGAPPVVNAARVALDAAGLFALEALVFALDDEPRLAGRTVLPVLAELGDPALDALTIAAGNASALVRRNALIALRLFERGAAASARGAVTKLEHDDDRNVRLEARATRDWLEGIDRRVVAREPLALPHLEFAMRALEPAEIAAISGAIASNQLIGFIRDGRRRVRENAIRALGSRGVYHPWLGFALKDDSLDVQRAAARALKTLGAKALPAAPQLIEALEEDDAPIIFDAKDTLIALGADVVPAIVVAARTTPDRFRSNLLPIVDKLGEAATPAMIAALDHASAFVIMNALMCIEVLAERGGQAAMAKVIALTGHPLPALVRTAKKTLMRLEGRTPAEFRKEAVPMPIAGFDTGSLSADVINANLAAVDREWLRSAIFDGRDRVRENAAACIGHLGAEGAEFVSLLVIALKDPQTEVQIAAAEAFGSLALGDAEAIPALIASLRLAREAMRRAALTALDRFGPARVAAVAIYHLVGLEDRMLQSMGRVAHRMAEAFVPALSKLAADPEASLTARENAVVILGDLVARARPAEEILISLVTNQDGMLAFKAATALARVGTPGPTVADRLAAALLKEKRPSVIQALRHTAKVLRRRRAD